ncbi:unnamed protein product [Linum trigynum]|uniref:Uncharacterized protein n=1 Tax=Linum trigynum TaxID=586398 RepID=A0AAV2DE35_9ROSI
MSLYLPLLRHTQLFPSPTLSLSLTLPRHPQLLPSSNSLPPSLRLPIQRSISERRWSLLHLRLACFKWQRIQIHAFASAANQELRPCMLVFAPPLPSATDLDPNPPLDALSSSSLIYLDSRTQIRI